MNLDVACFQCRRWLVDSKWLAQFAPQHLADRLARGNMIIDLISTNEEKSLPILDESEAAATVHD